MVFVSIIKFSYLYRNPNPYPKYWMPMVRVKAIENFQDKNHQGAPEDN